MQTRKGAVRNDVRSRRPDHAASRFCLAKALGGYARYAESPIPVANHHLWRHMELLATRLTKDIQEQITRRVWLLRSVSIDELERKQGHIDGLEEAMRIIDEFFRK